MCRLFGIILKINVLPFLIYLYFIYTTATTEVIEGSTHHPLAKMGQSSKVNILKTKGNLRFLIVFSFIVPHRLYVYKVSSKSVNGQGLWDFYMGGNPTFTKTTDLVYN